MAKDYYKILGVDKNTSEDELKKAYRTLAHKYHPDKGGDTEKFKEINEAFQVLGDKEKRAKYDQFGSAAFEQGGSGGAGFGDFGDFASAFGGMGDIFESFGFGSNGRRGRQSRGQDIGVDVELSFSEAAFGCNRDISLRKMDTCSHCNGRGGEPGAALKKCATCHGLGQVTQNQRTILGTMQTVQTCGSCDGFGQIPEKACKECKGRGAYEHTSKISVKIPTGIDNGQEIRLSGRGAALGRGDLAGDLYVRVHVKKDAELRREEFHIYSTVAASFVIAALGGSVSVRTLDGNVDLKIPEGTQGGTVMRLKGRGVPHVHGTGRGDHFVEVQIAVPKKLSRNQQKLLEEFKAQE